jgi:hypothetical protein
MTSLSLSTSAHHVPSHPSPETVPANGQPLTLAETIEHESMAYRAWGTPIGDFLARSMERLAQLVRWTGASTPDEHDARIEVWDAQIAESHFDRGYSEGHRAARAELGQPLE